MNHAEYQEQVKRLPSTALRHIIEDAKAAIAIRPDGPNAGYHADEVSYCSQELARRAKQKAYLAHGERETLAKIWKLLLGAGFDDMDMVESVRQLIERVISSEWDDEEI